MMRTLLVGFMLITNMTLFAASSYKATTAQNPDIDDDKFSIMISYLPEDKLFVEAQAWKKLLEDASRDVAIAQLNIKKQNDKIELHKKKIETQKEKIETKEEATSNIDKKAEKIAQKAEKKVKEVEVAKEKAEEKKIDVLEDLAKLREKRTKISDKLNLILLEINERIGTKVDGTEKDEVLAYRRYINSVSGVKIDITDSTSTIVNIKEWLISDQGGLRWLKNIAIFISIILLSLLASYIIRNGVTKALKLSGCIIGIRDQCGSHNGHSRSRRFCCRFCFTRNFEQFCKRNYDDGLSSF
ncbi:MAG: hypothetical protein B5M52_07380 [Helicobacteraceae bacterium 4484_230]|nr:MAG: hypothetical protein B5M52_07380 [Helicobacteraceae bacterium 4484_230]